MAGQIDELKSAYRYCRYDNLIISFSNLVSNTVMSFVEFSQISSAVLHLV